ncbi:MAG: paraquat-inducible protein B [Candidatus Brocadia sp.]|jgi:Paraquat-inducible protein B|uniref:Paraquat-inducible protein B n=1 Tax=Candidatus Brocadia fulgida TaxID=380242 RepID=A0A0M2URI6_9BACT|nr:MAG: Paraquat-inducible protein B [Candidatus Brocadia fulgida]MCC6326633.1 MCE family protein [Candidatus Brocadia sp.]RIJ93270.1 MAG: paraquat-inducible protein B [Candidatus Brocadia sp.]UJS19637.1 MAG: MlaD family protein [Candidatus Brocadia sp.]
MSKPANKTLIGAFIIGAIALLVAAVLIFGSGKFLKKTHYAVVFFEGSIKGLNEGAPVIFSGVKIGAVTNIRLVYDPVNDSVRIPVIIELEPDKFERTDVVERQPEKNLKLLIERGLRAQLQMQSVVTGQLMIALNFFPDKPANYIGFVKEYPEIPSIPTPLQELAKTIEDLHLKEIVKKLDVTLDSVKKLIQHIDNKIDPLITNITKTSEVSQNTLEIMQATLKQTNNTLSVFSETARSARSLTEYLQQHPDSILKGKPR